MRSAECRINYPSPIILAGSFAGGVQLRKVQVCFLLLDTKGVDNLLFMLIIKLVQKRSIIFICYGVL
jgi:hypothetical protein